MKINEFEMKSVLTIVECLLPDVVSILIDSAVNRLLFNYNNNKIFI